MGRSGEGSALAWGPRGLPALILGWGGLPFTRGKAESSGVLFPAPSGAL